MAALTASIAASWTAPMAVPTATQHNWQEVATWEVPQQHLQQVPLHLLLEQVQQLTRWRCQLLPTNIPTIFLIAAPALLADSATLSTASPMLQLHLKHQAQQHYNNSYPNVCPTASLIGAPTSVATTTPTANPLTETQLHFYSIYPTLSPTGSTQVCEMAQ